MTIYDEMQAVVREIMPEFKQGEIIYQHPEVGDGPEDDPGEPTLTPFTINATASGVKFKYVQSGMAIESDLQVTAPVDERFAFLQEGFIDIDGERYKINKLLPKPAAGTTVAYTMIIRK